LKFFPTKKMKRVVLITQGRKMLVTVWSNGWIEYGPAYDPDVAARAFWGAVARNYPLPPKEAL